MRVAADLIMLLGAVLALIAGLGALRLRTTYARLHAAGKASPVAILVTSVGAAIHLGWGAAALLSFVASAMVLTLPVGVHLLYRAVHRTHGSETLGVDDLLTAEQRAGLR